MCVLVDLETDFQVNCYTFLIFICNLHSFIHSSMELHHLPCNIRRWLRFYPVHSTPYFELRSLKSGVGYNVFLIASNAKGRSNSTVRQVFTVSNPEKQTDTSSLLASTPSLANLKTFLPLLLLGCAGAIAMTAIVVVFIVRKRANLNSNSTNDVMGDQSTGGSSDRGELASYALSTQRTMQSSQEVGRDLCADSNESMAKNPDIIDIIPQGNHFDYISL